MSKIEPIDIENLKKLTPAPAILIDQLRTWIASFRQIETNKSTSGIYYVGGGSGSGSIWLIVICCLVYQRFKHHQSNETRSPPPVAHTAPEKPNMVHTREGAIRTGHSSALGQRTVGFQVQVGNRRLVMDNDMQNAFASALLDELEDLGTGVTEHCRRLRARQYSAISQIEN